MILYEYLITFDGCNHNVELDLIVSNDNINGLRTDDVYANSMQYLLNSSEFSKYMACEVTSALVCKSDNIKFYRDPDNCCSTDMVHEIIIRKPSISNKLSYYIKLLKERVRTTYRSVDGKYNIFRILLNKYSLIDTQETWYMSSFRNSLPYNHPMFSEGKSGDICTYTADVVYRYALNRYKKPIFRLRVLHPTNNKMEELLNNAGECIVDDSMVFTLEENPRPIQSYESVKRRLKGNIISEERVQQLVNIVSKNYDEILTAWYSHPSKFGSCYNEYGLNIRELKFGD